MIYKYISDSHIHSNCSFDGINSVDDICKKAISLNMHSITITDHFESYLYYNNQKEKYGDFKRLLPQSIKEIREAQVKYDGKIKVYCGLEVGEPLHDIATTREVMALTDYDFILSSIHRIKSYEDFYYLKYTRESAKELLLKYFEEIAIMIKEFEFDSLAHLTYPFRYIVGRDKVEISIDEFKKEIDEILKLLVEKNIALEVNTSGLRQEIGVTLPEKDIILKYYELGGKYITIGSDAHKVEDVCKGIEETYSMLKECGYKQYTIFEKRTPKLVDIEKCKSYI